MFRVSSIRFFYVNENTKRLYECFITYNYDKQIKVKSFDFTVYDDQHQLIEWEKLKTSIQQEIIIYINKMNISLGLES